MIEPISTAAVFARVIDLATACQGRTGLLTRPPGADPPFVVGGPVPPEQALYDYLITLPVGVIYLLTAVMYVGRDGIPADCLADQYEHVSDSFADPAWAIEQLVKKRHALARFLTDGTAALTTAGRDLDALP